jgi:hypothetical protein
MNRQVDEFSRMAQVDVNPAAHRATEGDEEAVLQGLYGAPTPLGFFSLASVRTLVTPAAPKGAQALLAKARASIGLHGRPNPITREYASRHGKYFLTAPWCNMSVTYWARHSGNADPVLPDGDRAYTVWHAEDFKKRDAWMPGTVANLSEAQPGDVVFFDWGQSNSISAIDHIGLVEAQLGGGRIQTIEGNTGDACRRRVRSASVVAGFGRPAFNKAADWTEKIVKSLPELKKGDSGEAVETLQGLLIARSHPEVKVTGRFDAVTDKAVRAVQAWGKVDVDGVVFKDTWPVLLRVTD